MIFFSKKVFLSFLYYFLIFIASLCLGVLIFVLTGFYNFLLLQFAPNNLDTIYFLLLYVFASYMTFSVYQMRNPNKLPLATSVILMVGIPVLMLCISLWYMQYGLLECADAVANAPAQQRVQQMLSGISVSGGYGLMGFAYATIEMIICMIVMICVFNKRYKQ